MTIIYKVSLCGLKWSLTFKSPCTYSPLIDKSVSYQVKTKRGKQHKSKYKSQLRFIWQYKKNICKNRYDKEIYYFSSINMSERSHWRLRVPIFSSFGVLWVSVLQYTVQKHEVFNGPFPQMCQDRQRFMMSLKAGIYIGNLALLPHLHWQEGGYIHCSSNDGANPTPC